MAPFFSLTLPLFLFLSPFFLWDRQFFTSYEYCIKLATRLLVLRGLPQTQAGRPRPTQRALLPLFSCKAQPTDCSESKPAELSSLHTVTFRTGLANSVQVCLKVSHTYLCTHIPHEWKWTYLLKLLNCLHYHLNLNWKLWKSSAWKHCIIAEDVCGIQGYVSRCMAMENIRCDVDENLWPDQQEQERQEIH